MLPELRLEFFPSPGVLVLKLDTCGAERIGGTELFHGFLFHPVGGFHGFALKLFAGVFAGAIAASANDQG